MDILPLKLEAFGMDFSDLNLRIVNLEKKGNFFRLASWNETSIPLGVITEGEIKDQEKLISIIRSALDKVKGGKIKKKYIIASLPEKRAFLQVIKMPKMDEEELKTAVAFEAESYIPLPIDQAYFDYEIISSIGKEEMEILIGAMPKNIVDPYVLCLKQAGLIPRVMEVESQSIVRSLIKNGMSPFPVLIIDFGKSRTSFMVFVDNSLRFTSSISFSSQQLTDLISKKLNIDIDQAEKLKIKYGSDFLEKSRERKLVSEITNLFIGDLVKQAKKHIDYYQSHALFPDGASQIKKILLCGRGSNLKGLTTFIASETKIPTEIANPWVNILSDSNRNIPEISFKESLGYATVLGLALRGAK